ncbi:hypothetical protein L596_029227 [Steinernema carpocapsae]|uniref:NADP-dependent oxidoreductase domain-containing protein n=1 Tax=Steinernema carpocapsae TaxID=34508 RepID=A0A4V5ZXE8_STECR|nr:hypothetical protein L596_029227 [Steinernema carpocapsae]
MNRVVPTVKLLTGAEMPLLGLGTWQSTSEQMQKAMRMALDAGYRLFDTAKIYRNEEDIGVVLNEYLKEGKVKREELFITTKLWCTHNQPEKVEEQCRESLKKLQLNYVDLYLIHAPVSFSEDMVQLPEIRVEDSWKGMEGVFEKGLAKAIGVSNFNISQIERVLKIAKVPIHNLQVEAYLNFPQFELQEVCNKHNISLTAYGPLGSPGRLNFTGVGWATGPDPLEDERVKKLAAKYGKTPAQILLRLCVIWWSATSARFLRVQMKKDSRRISTFLTSS